MAYSGLRSFINDLEKVNELRRIKVYVNPELEITEVTDRVTKSGGPALLFENTGTYFQILINAFASDKRMAMAIGRKNLDDAGKEINELFELITVARGTLSEKLAALPSIIKLATLMPARRRSKGRCQQVIHKDPDLGILPVLRCWPHDGGRFITLPVVHTVHPETGKTNAGMYRMQILGRNTTAIHWQRHKTGANHFEAWKKKGQRMPVSVILGGDPVYTYTATAPLPEGVDEYILAGFLRKKRVKMVRCITNNLYVPEDADIVIEGYVDTTEQPVWEGPFGDHTGFYSLADWYPRFHVTCITHSRKAVFPATIVGIPPQEDSWLAKATERIFLTPVKMALQPEIEDFHMPTSGVVHNLVIVRIRKSYPGQGMKVINSLFGAGQMMFSKYLIVVSGETDIRDYSSLARTIFENTDFGKDFLFCHGPLDVLDHSSDAFSFGGKLGIDATIKHPEEISEPEKKIASSQAHLKDREKDFLKYSIVVKANLKLFDGASPVAIVSIDRSGDPDSLEKVKSMFRREDPNGFFRLILVVDRSVDPFNLEMVAWQFLGNSDPQRDHEFLSTSSVLIDGTAKIFRKGGFKRKWPNVVCSDPETVASIDRKWESLDLGPFIKSPSDIYRSLLINGKEEVINGIL